MNTLETKPCNIKSANELDKNDPLSHFRERFHFPKFNSNKPYIYFSGNSLGLQPDTAEQYVKEELEAWKQMGVNAHLGAKRPWLAYHEFLTSYSAEIVGAQDKEVVVMNALTVNLHLLMTSFYRPKGVRKKILIEKHAFPSDRYAIQSQLRFHGNDPNDDLIILESNDEKFISMNTIVDYLSNYGEEIALVLIGGVNYYTGQAFDMAAITDKAQNCGCRVGFDLAHAAGNIKLNLHDWGVDFAAWCGYTTRVSETVTRGADVEAKSLQAPLAQPYPNAFPKSFRPAVTKSKKPAFCNHKRTALQAGTAGRFGNRC